MLARREIADLNDAAALFGSGAHVHGVEAVEDTHHRCAAADAPRFFRVHAADCGDADRRAAYTRRAHVFTRGERKVGIAAVSGYDHRRAAARADIACNAPGEENCVGMYNIRREAAQKRPHENARRKLRRGGVEAVLPEMPERRIAQVVYLYAVLHAARDRCTDSPGPGQALADSDRNDRSDAMPRPDIFLCLTVHEGRAIVGVKPIRRNNENVHYPLPVPFFPLSYTFWIISIYSRAFL